MTVAVDLEFDGGTLEQYDLVKIPSLILRGHAGPRDRDPLVSRVSRHKRGHRSQAATFPGLKMPSGSSARLIVRIISTAAAPCSAMRKRDLP